MCRGLGDVYKGQVPTGGPGCRQVRPADVGACPYAWHVCAWRGTSVRAGVCGCACGRGAHACVCTCRPAFRATAVRTDTAFSLLRPIQWGDGESKEQNEWIQLKDIINGSAGPRSTTCWLGIQAKAQDASPEAAKEVCARRCGKVTLDGSTGFHCRVCQTPED